MSNQNVQMEPLPEFSLVRTFKIYSHVRCPYDDVRCLIMMMMIDFIRGRNSLVQLFFSSFSFSIFVLFISVFSLFIWDIFCSFHLANISGLTW